ncbi:MAG: hypothetical protein ETSY2_25290 [Candidatus Entotheonella gemina]|uniref:Uncharacterized protein n=1 Tax=Candidatus Entotheonella gemina TaxID=1429439 RepID=W4M524_9BACT|nr:MAG: hypothetical protein ETSY2_25290 [Candidatus Entotheonella gemina]
MHRHADVAWHFLLFSGYLKPTTSNRESNTGHIDLAIPNREVETVFEDVFSIH